MDAKLVIAWLAAWATLLTLAGLVRRRRLAVCYAFAVYLAVVLASDLLQLLWPDRFHRQWFWLAKELVIALCRFALALELTYRTFRSFPGARATARHALLFLLLVTLTAVLLGSGDLPPLAGEAELQPLISRLQPRLLNGTIWLLTSITALILWYRVPVEPLHKAILSGLLPYLLVFTTSLNLIESWGWDVRSRVGYLHTSAFLLVLAYWMLVVWQRRDPPLQAPGAPLVAAGHLSG